MNTRPQAYLKNIIALAQQAGEKIMEVYSREFDVTHKDDNTPLTEADLAAHNTIVAGLKALSPEIPILSEESAKIPFSTRQTWNRYWLVDPLDGTREFIKRNGEFTVNIALIENHEPILGVIDTPVTGICYFASRGNGAFKLTPKNTRAQRIHTRKKQPIKSVVAGSRSHSGETLKNFLAKIGEFEILSMGSSLKSCLVAEGKADIYPRLGPTSEWDTAAAQCIVEEAGGRIVGLDMQPLRYNEKKSLLNPHFLVIGDTHYNWAKYLAD